MMKLATSLFSIAMLAGCASAQVPVIHESTTVDRTVSGQMTVSEGYVTAVPIINSRRSFEVVKYYEQLEVCRTLSNSPALPQDVGAVAKQRCTIEEVPRQQSVQNGWIITFRVNDTVYEQYVNFNPGSVVLVRITNNSIVGVNP